MLQRTQKEYGMKFDGEDLCIYLSRNKSVYRAWPNLQCMIPVKGENRWYSSSYGKIFLSEGSVGSLDSLGEILPRYSNRNDILNMVAPVAISDRKEGKYYSWNLEDKIDFLPWYAENKERIMTASNGFLNRIPSKVRKEAGAFKNGYIGGNQWFLIKQSQLYPAFIDLMRANPALAYSFAHRKVLGLKTARLGKKDTERLLAGKQRKIAAFLGLEDSNAIVHILKKIPASACIRHRIQGFLEKLNRKELWKTLLHLETINESVLSFYSSLNNYPKYFIPQKTFVEDVATHFHTRDSVFSSGDEIWTNCLRPLYRIFYYLENEKHDFRSVSEMRNKYEKVIELLNRQNLPARERKYSKPPFPGSESIVPISTRRELFEEGFDQKNCVYSYDKDIISGRCFVYRILAPERATLSLTKESNAGIGKKVWRMEEIKTKANNRPRPETILAVRRWFNQVAGKKGELLWY